MKIDIFFSVVTVCYNAEDTIEETIKSIVKQTDKDYEYIVIDGLSCDNTVNVIKKYENYIDYFVSEKDEGIYHAMNKGLKIASGKYIFFLNSGDRFINNDVLKNIKYKIINQPIYPSIVYGNLATHSKVIINSKFSNNKKLLTGTIGHQACFIQLKDHTFFDISFKIAADYKILLNLLFIQNKPSLYVDMVIAHYDTLKLDKSRKERCAYRIKTLKEKIEVISESISGLSYLKSYIYYFTLLIKFYLLKIFSLI